MTPRGLAIAWEGAGRATATRRGISLKAVMGKEYTKKRGNELRYNDLTEWSVCRDRNAHKKQVAIEDETRK